MCPSIDGLITRHYFTTALSLEKYLCALFGDYQSNDLWHVCRLLLPRGFGLPVDFFLPVILGENGEPATSSSDRQDK